jgi:hypothetical protein
VRLVVLNACLTGKVELNLLRGIAPALLAANIPAVVAMQSSVGDQAGVVFAEDFYQNLAEYKPIDTCVSRGRRAIRNSTATRDWGLATLYMRAPDGILFEQPAAKDAAASAAAPAEQQNSAAKSSGVNIDMGSGNNFSNGAFSFGAIAGGDLSQSTINNTNAPSTPAATPARPSDSSQGRREHLQTLRATLKERLYDLELQEAKFGKLYAPVYLTGQLRETRAELAQVESELAQLGG